MNNNRLIKGDAAIPLRPKGWRPLADSSWIDGLRYFAPDARKKIIWIKLGDLCRYILAYPFLLAGLALSIIPYAPYAIVALLAQERDFLEKYFEFWLSNLNAAEFFRTFFTEYVLAFKCKKCGRKIVYGVTQRELSRHKKDGGIWDWYDNKKKICRYCQEEV